MCQTCPIFQAVCLLEFLSSVSAIKNALYARKEACACPFMELVYSNKKLKPFILGVLAGGGVWELNWWCIRISSKTLKIEFTRLN